MKLVFVGAALLLSVCVASGQGTPAASSKSAPLAATNPRDAAVKAAEPVANHATDAEIRKMFEAMHLRENNVKFLEGLRPYLEREARQQTAGFATMDDSDRKYFQQITEEEMRKIVEPAFIDAVIDASVPAYASRLTSDDVKSITAFYGSPAGEHLQNELPNISKAAMASSMPIVQKRAQEIAEDERKRLNDYMTKKYGTTAPSTSLVPEAKSPDPSTAPRSTPPASAPQSQPSGAPK